MAWVGSVPICLTLNPLILMFAPYWFSHSLEFRTYPWFKKKKKRKAKILGESTKGILKKETKAETRFKVAAGHRWNWDLCRCPKLPHGALQICLIDSREGLEGRDTYKPGSGGGRSMPVVQEGDVLGILLAFHPMRLNQKSKQSGSAAKAHQRLLCKELAKSKPGGTRQGPTCPGM